MLFKLPARRLSCRPSTSERSPTPQVQSAGNMGFAAAKELAPQLDAAAQNLAADQSAHRDVRQGHHVQRKWRVLD